MEHIKAQAVVCGGSGGFAAAYTLAKGGINVILIEKNKGIGGTSVFAGVNCWEPGVSIGKVHRELFSALSKIPDAAAVSKTVPNSRLFYPESEPYPHNTVSCFNLYPNGEINVNMLPTVKGSDYIKLKASADEVCRRLVYSYWNRLQNDYGMSGYKFMYLFPMPGIRESYRLKGRYVLTENDLLTGFEHQARRDEIISLANHARDTHGSGGCNELENPYGIPFSCMLPKEYDNLYVCCRGASFSHIAASSARLSRTMLSLGEAAAHAVIMQINDGKIDFPTLKNMQNIPF